MINRVAQDAQVNWNRYIIAVLSALQAACLFIVSGKPPDDLHNLAFYAGVANAFLIVLVAMLKD